MNIEEAVLKTEHSLQYYIRKYIKQHISNDDYKFIMPSGSRSGYLHVYGLAKTRKPDCAMHLGVSMIGTSQYNLSQFLNDYISPCF